MCSAEGQWTLARPLEPSAPLPEQRKRGVEVGINWWATDGRRRLARQTPHFIVNGNHGPFWQFANGAQPFYKEDLTMSTTHSPTQRSA